LRVQRLTEFMRRFGYESGLGIRIRIQKPNWSPKKRKKKVMPEELFGGPQTSPEVELPYWRLVI
jgi:hypothetical protein